jgi:hypothetical protein
VLVADADEQAVLARGLLGGGGGGAVAGGDRLNPLRFPPRAACGFPAF